MPCRTVIPASSGKIFLKTTEKERAQLLIATSLREKHEEKRIAEKIEFLQISDGTRRI